MKPKHIARTEQTEYGAVYIDADSGYAFRGPEYTPRWQSLKRAGVDTGWEQLPDGWFKSTKRSQSPSVIAREIRNVSEAAFPSLSGGAMLLAAGAVLVLALKKK